MDYNNHPVDYPSLAWIGGTWILNIFANLTGHWILGVMEAITATIGFILTVFRFADWIKTRFLNKKDKK